MGAVSMGSIFSVEDVLNTERDEKSGSILLQTGDVGFQDATGQQTELWQQPGFCSRPSKAKAGKDAAQCVSIVQSDRNIAIAFREVRNQEMYGQLDYGEFCVFAPGQDGTAQGRILGKADGSINLVTTDTNTKDGVTVLMKVAPTGFELSTPWGGMKLDENGWKLYTSQSGTVKNWLELRRTGDEGATLAAPLIQCASGTFHCYSGNVLLGANATPATACAYGASPANLLSATVFVSP